MTPWALGYVLSNATYWAFFLVWRNRYRPSKDAQLVGILHVFFAGLVDFPLRPWLDPGFHSWGIGFLHFEGRWTVLPLTLILAWTLAAAWLPLACGRGPWMLWISVGDWIWGLNIFCFQLINLWRGAGRYDFAVEQIQIRGVLAEIIVRLIFAGAFSAAGRWAFNQSGVEGGRTWWSRLLARDGKPVDTQRRTGH